MKILGIKYYFSPDLRTLECVVPWEQVEKCQKQINEIINDIRKKCLRRKDLQKMLGRANFIVTNRESRSGVQIMNHPYEWTVEENFKEWITNDKRRRALIIALRMVEIFVSEVTPTVFNVNKENKEIAFLYTDASGDGANGKPMIGGILCDTKGEWHAYSLVVPDEYGKEIDVLETLAVSVSIELWQDLVSNTVLSIGVDNIVTLMALVKCKAKKTEISKMTSHIAIFNARMKIAVIYDYIKSELNPGDAMTRLDYLNEAIRVFNPKMYKVNLNELKVTKDDWAEKLKAVQNEGGPIRSQEDHRAAKYLKIDKGIEQLL